MDYASLKYVSEHAGSPMNPVLSNLLVYETPAGNRMQAQNGRYTVDVPTDLPPLLANADRLAAVWSACNTEPRVSLGTTYITASSGRIRAKVALLDPGQYPRTDPTPKSAHGVDGLVEALRSLLPYVADDASRPWATSICLTGEHAYATNNVIIARAPIDVGIELPVNVPGGSVDAVLSAGELQFVGADDKSVTFYMAGDVWVRCQLVAGLWPTATADDLLGAIDAAAWLSVHADLEKTLVVAAKLADTRHPVVVFRGGELTLEDDTLLASDLDPLPEQGKVNAKMAALVFNAGTHVQWHTPRKDVHAFRAGPVVGVFGGLR